MNPKTIFKLHEPQHGFAKKDLKETYIHMFFSYGYYENMPETGKRKYIPLKISTGKKINPAYWHDRPYYRAMKASFDAAEPLNQYLDQMEDLTNSIYHEFEQKGLMPTPKQLKLRIERELDEITKKPIRPLNDYISNFIIEAKRGKRLTSKNYRYKKQSIRNLEGFQIQFSNYQAHKGKMLDYDHITVEFLDDFIRYFEGKGYAKSSTVRHIKHLRMFMRAAREEGLHDNVEIDNRRFRIRPDSVEHVFLNELEIHRLNRLNLSNKTELEIVRDVFLMGCYLAQRYNDYRKINKSMLINLGEGRKGIRIFQSRNAKHVIIPLRKEADELLNKYKYTLPYTNEQMINSRIQVIAKMAGINDLNTIQVRNGGNRVAKKAPKYELIKTHTARRSGCTNMYLSNIPVNEIMAISGHQTVTDFLKYIRATDIQLASKLADHPYFLQTV